MSRSGEYSEIRDRFEDSTDSAFAAFLNPDPYSPNPCLMLADNFPRSTTIEIETNARQRSLPGNFCQSGAIFSCLRLEFLILYFQQHVRKQLIARYLEPTYPLNSSASMAYRITRKKGKGVVPLIPVPIWERERAEER